MMMRSLMLMALWVTPAAASTWTVLPMQRRGVDADAAATFRDLLVSELGARTGAGFVDGRGPCADVPCAQKAGRAVGAQVAVYGTVSTLGRNIVVTAAAVDVRTGAVRSQQRMSVNAIEDLEPAAARIAAALATGRQVEQTAELGAITRKEVRPDRRREGHRGPSFRLGGGGQIGAADTGGATLRFDLGYWYEARRFAIEPSIGGRFAADEPGDAFGMNLDIGAYYIPGLSDVTPFVGAGGGLRFVGLTRQVRADAGTVVHLEASSERFEEAWGPGAFGRIGVLLFRTYSVRMTVSVDYDVAFVDLFGEGPVQSLNGAIGVLF